MIEWVIYVFLGIGLFFNLLASLGLLRFPDVYTRLHAGTKCTTFGAIFVAGAVIIYGAWRYYDGHAAMLNMSIHAFIALVAILLTNPTGAHAIARAAHRSGVLPVQAVADDLVPEPSEAPAEKEAAEEGDHVE